MNIEKPRECEAIGYTREQIEEAVTTVCCYSCMIMLYVMQQTIETTLQELTKFPDVNNGPRGAKRDMQRVRAALQNTLLMRNTIAGELRPRIDIICREQYDYIDRTIRQMQVSALNYMLRYKVKGAHAMSHAIVMQMVCDMAVNTINLRAADLREVRHLHTSKVSEFLRPDNCNKQCKVLTNHVAVIYGNRLDDLEDFDINNCQDLRNGIRAIDNLVNDLDLMEMHTAFALEELHGTEYMIENCPDAYYKLHPHKDPKYIEAKRQREEQEQREAKERREAMEQAEWQESHLDEYAMSQLSDRFKVSKH